MKAEILKMLKEADDHISGQQLCEQFQVSRTAVWKVINQLKEEGYQVEAVRNKGYRIIESPDVLTREELSVQIGDATRWAGRRLSVLRKRIRPMSGQGSWEKTARRTERLSLRNSRLPGEDAGQRMGIAGGKQHLYVASSAPGISAEQSADADDRDGL